MRGRGLPALRPRRDAADLDKAEAEPQQRVRHLAILVEARRHPDRIGKIQPEGAHLQPRIVRAAPARQRRPLQRPQSQPVGILRVETMQERARQALEKADQGGKTPEEADGIPSGHMPEMIPALKTGVQRHRKSGFPIQPTGQTRQKALIPTLVGQ